MTFPVLYVDCGFGAGGRKLAAGTLCLLVICLSVAFSAGAEMNPPGPEAAQARNMVFAVYNRDGTTALATIKVASLFTDHAQMGFFRVNLLPQPVLQGVRVELAQASAAVDWLSALRWNVLGAGENGAEVRDLSVSVAADSRPRLAIDCLKLGPGGSAQPIRLEGVTLQTRDGAVKLPRARLEAAPSGPRLSWTDAGRGLTWDFVTQSVAIEPATLKP